MQSLIPIEHQNQRILTTQQIAEGYEVEPHQIVQNFNNNKDRYEKGKHYYLLKGEELKAFKNSLENFYVVDRHAPSLYLWTERGAMLHAKSLNTDRAWELYENLLDTYFRAQQLQSTQLPATQSYDPLLDRMDRLIDLLEQQHQPINVIEPLALDDYHYYSDPVVITVIALLKENPNGFSKTASEFLPEIKKHTGTAYKGNVKALGKHFKRIALQLFHYDNVIHQKRRRDHYFNFGLDNIRK